MAPRLLLPLADPAPAEVWAEGARFHHLVRVLRLTAGDAVEVFDGKGRAYAATVAELEPERARLTLGAQAPRPALRRFSVVQGLPKGDKLEWVLQKATELGASRFAPAQCERSVVKLDPAKEPGRRARWQRIVEEAARQCGRAEVPEVAATVSLADAAAALAPGTHLFVLDEEERALRLGAAFLERVTEASAPVALVVGPEGGLSRGEVDALRALGGVPVSLGARVLRTETAAVAALCVLLHLDGELG